MLTSQAQSPSMKALTLIGACEFAYGESERPTPGKGEVLLQIKACGICGSDIHGMDGSSGRRIPPLIMGHEASGEIVELGPEVGGWKLGDRVTFDSTISCGTCGWCLQDLPNLCDHRRVLGVSCGEYRQHGCFAEYAVVPTRILFELPANLSYTEAAFAEPVSVALHAVAQIQVPKHEPVLVVGAGLIGLLVIQALKRAGAEEIWAVDRAESRLQLARDFGATRTYQASNQDLVQEIQAQSQGGVAAAFEVVGMTPTINLAIRSLRKKGQVVLVGNLEKEAKFPLQEVVTKELSIFGTCAIANEYPQALQAIADQSIRVKPLLSGEVPLEEGASWFARLYSGKEDLLKVVLVP